MGFMISAGDEWSRELFARLPSRWLMWWPTVVQFCLCRRRWKAMLGYATLGMPMTLTSTMSWGGSEAGRRQQREHSLSSLHPSPRVTFVPLAWGVVFVLLLHTKTNCQRAALHVKCLSLRLMLLTQAAALDQAAGVLRHSYFHETAPHLVSCCALPVCFPCSFPSTFPHL